MCVCKNSLNSISQQQAAKPLPQTPPQVPAPKQQPSSSGPAQIPQQPSTPANELELTAANIQEFRKHCITVLSAVDGHCLLAQFPEHYLKVRGVKFQPANYKAKKLLQLLEAIPDEVDVSHCSIK